ncbi:Anoctamin-4 [Holothuria leucospilota]|uniref:Anoctamin n=1 Tax=Holothuria leucospilota TaxID=206669 RepID=A0A9Q1BSF4_HOLLE|nr:Anoctamin-4 [Holothuria leucospilota]
MNLGASSSNYGAMDDEDKVVLTKYSQEKPVAPSEIELNDTPSHNNEKQPLHSGSPAKKPENSDATVDQYFTDGVRKIDYIIAYKRETKEGEDEQKRERRRREYFNNLKEEGLEMEEAAPNSEEDKVIFVKLHAPWDVLARYAEEMKIKMPTKENDIEEPASIWSCLRKLPNPFALSEDFIKPEPNYFTLAFVRDREAEFIMESRDTFFSTATRGRIVHEILEKCRYDPDDKTKFGYPHMIANGSFIAAYPLHDGDWKSEHSLLTHGPLNDRHLLYEEWASPKKFYKQQPLDLIRSYFGEKIGIYFSWLGYYTVMLTYAAIFGVAAFLWGCITLGSNIKVAEICDEEGVGSIIMCPLCNERCDYWHLWSSCFYSKLTYLFDNGATVFFACFMSLWATMFCEFWKRRENSLAYDWDLFGFEENEENIRPEFEAKAPDKRISPITKLTEPYMALRNKFPRIAASIVSIMFMILLVVAAVVAVIIYRIAVKVALARTGSEFVSSMSSIVTSCTASAISVIIIMILQNIYERIAVWLTDLELHRTETEYEDSFTFKMYLFAFVNYYSTSFYIAFLKGKIPGNPSDYGKIFGLRQEECDASGCMQELFINIAITMCGKQFFNNFMELGTPVILNCIRQYRGRQEAKKGDGRYDQWEKDLDLADLGPRGLFKEYLEMVVQFGFTTIFVAAFPLAPFFALLNNLIEIRLDAFKFISQLRRPYAARSQDIGAWYAILLAVGNLSVLTNALVLAFTSEFIPQAVYKGRYGNGELSGYMEYSLSIFNVSHFEEKSAPNKTDFPEVTECRYRGYYTGPNPPYEYTKENWIILAFKLVFVLLYEHVIFVIKMAIAYMVPDVPDFVRDQIRRENYLAQQALHEAALSKSKKDDAATGGYETV